MYFCQNKIFQKQNFHHLLRCCYIMWVSPLAGLCSVRVWWSLLSQSLWEIVRWPRSWKSMVHARMQQPWWSVSWTVFFLSHRKGK